ncbi:hypothetical protein D083_1900 [Dickeya solani RNS 08.23.3.1.A]|nr:hypothetical protein D083_1900 [Dickeya solani RNS 08.23.3.1.A]
MLRSLKRAARLACVSYIIAQHPSARTVKRGIPQGCLF